jgi:serine/threonine protein phosphatase PrpC
VSDVIFGAATSNGAVRRMNEDCFLTCPPLFAVADGMGGHAAGDVASALAVETLRTHAQETMSADLVLGALHEANDVIVEEASRRGDVVMGTTVTGLAVLETGGGRHVMVFNVGDSRVYRLRDGQLVQLTVDHSEVQELVWDCPGLS